MPLAQQASQQQHHHLLHALGTFLHSRQPSQSNSNLNPSSSQSPVPVSDSSPLAGSGYGASDVPLLYQTFESRLTQRLSSLLPADEPPLFSLSSFTEFMGLLLATQTDLRLLVPGSQTQKRAMDEFLERSVKILDVCRDIKEQIAEMENLQGMLQAVAPCLASRPGMGIHEGQVIRARKILAHLLLHLEVEKGDETHQHVEMRQSFRGRLRERLSGYSSRDGSPLRWRSWPSHHDPTAPLGHGSNSSASAPSLHALATSGSGPSLYASASAGHQQWHGNHASHAAPATHTSTNAHSHASEVIRALQALELSLVPPKLVVKDDEECFSAAVYAINVLSVFVLGTIMASFPSFGIKAYVIATINPPSSLGWSTAFLRLQEKAQEELRVRSKRRLGQAGMWELERLCSLMKRLFEMTSRERFPWSAEEEEEVKQAVSQFGLHVYELEQDLAAFGGQIRDFYNRIIMARLEVFELMSTADV